MMVSVPGPDAGKQVQTMMQPQKVLTLEFSVFYSKNAHLSNPCLLRLHVDPPGWLSLLCPPATSLVLGCTIFPSGWDAEVVQDMSGENTGMYSLGNCSVRWAIILAIIGILDALILSFLGFMLGNQQNDFLQEELKVNNKGEEPSQSLKLWVFMMNLLGNIKVIIDVVEATKL